MEPARINYRLVLVKTFSFVRFIVHTNDCLVKSRKLFESINYVENIKAQSRTQTLIESFGWIGKQPLY